MGDLRAYLVTRGESDAGGGQFSEVGVDEALARLDDPAVWPWFDLGQPAAEDLQCRTRFDSIGFEEDDGFGEEDKEALWEAKRDMLVEMEYEQGGFGPITVERGKPPLFAFTLRFPLNSQPTLLRYIYRRKTVYSHRMLLRNNRLLVLRPRTLEDPRAPLPRRRPHPPPLPQPRARPHLRRRHHHAHPGPLRLGQQRHRPGDGRHHGLHLPRRHPLGRQPDGAVPRGRHPLRLLARRHVRPGRGAGLVEEHGCGEEDAE